MRTPLTSIRAFSEILEQNPEMAAEQRQEFLTIVVKETERLTRLINEVLDLAKIESGRMDWKMETTDLRDLVKESAAAVVQLLTARSVDLTQDMPEDATPVSVDRDRITQVLINLLSNAAKFCKAKQGQIWVRVSNGSGKFKVEVSDNGRGIPPEQVAKIFEKFHQVSDEQDGKPKGTGLGLAISQRIVEHHGGRIWVEDTGPDGTTFAFVLPHTSAAGEPSAAQP